MSNEPARAAFPGQHYTHDWEGLSIHEYACIHSGIPETGIPEVDDVLRKAQRRNMDQRIRELEAENARLNRAIGALAASAIDMGDHVHIGIAQWAQFWQIAEEK